MQEWDNDQEPMPPFPSKLLEILMDASRFVNAFKYAISESIPHIYLSAFPFTPTASNLSHLQDWYPNTMIVESGQGAHWPAALQVLQGHSNSGLSVAFSPDGKCIVSGSDDGTIRLWDAALGEAIGKPL
jgi:WD40 repeat protein